mmetsp:Transcript_23312/g.22930  ORF Transcript_23312/g.22930 Transcript_23312/m.22930 type:complete len:325 (-) Transcript_23312:756-1730(-)
MMGGIELNLKKDNNMIQTELVREDWMNKPQEEMNEDEKMRLKEFEQKEKEFKEKQKKAWEQELKKLKGEIIENQLKFEERILTLFKKKLFYDVRVKEQELYIIRLTIMLHDAKETTVDQRKYFAERDKLEEELKEKEQKIQQFYDNLKFRDSTYQANLATKDQEAMLKQRFQNVNNKLILGFVKSGGRSKKLQGGGEISQKEQELLSKVVELDPFSSVDKDMIKQSLKEEEDIETYSYEKDNLGGLSEPDFDLLVQERHVRIKIEKDRVSFATEIQQLKDYISFLENKRNDVNDRYQGAFAAHKKATDRVEKLKYNYEVVIYLK